MDKEKESRVDAQAASERDKKGRFKKGWSGGPGRSHSSRKDELGAIEDLIDLVEVAAREGIIKSNDVDARIKAAKIALKVAELKKPKSSEGATPDLVIMPVISLLWDYASAYRQKTGMCVSCIEAATLIRNHLEGCPTSCMSNTEFDDFEIIDD